MSEQAEWISRMGDQEETRKTTNIKPGTKATVVALSVSMAGFEVGEIVEVYPGPLTGRAEFELLRRELHQPHRLGMVMVTEDILTLVRSNKILGERR